MKVEVDEVVHIVGSFAKSMTTSLHVDVKLAFDVPPALWSPGMTMMVERELQNSVTRLIAEAKKVK